MTTPGQRLRRARETNGFPTAKDAAIAMGVPIATYTQHEASSKHLPSRRADEYAAFFKITPEYLLYGRGEVPDRIPVLDRRGKATDLTVSMPPDASELTRAQESDLPGHFGMIAIYNTPQGARPSPDCNGRLCVIGYKSEGVEVQVVRLCQKGSSAKRFHLIGGALPMIDQEVLWVAPVICLVPA